MGVAYNPKIVTDGLILCLDAGNSRSYPGSGNTWTDLSGLGNNGTLTNGPTYSTDGSGSFLFDNTNDLVIGPNNSSFIFTASARNFTVEQWIKPTGLTGSFRAMSSVWGQGGGLDSWILCHSSGTLQFVWAPFSTTNFFIQGGTLVTNVWQHIAISRIGNDFFLYLNAVQTATGTNSATLAASYRLEIAHYGQSTNYFSGYISNTKIYNNKGLKAAEIQQNFNASRGRYGI